MSKKRGNDPQMRLEARRVIDQSRTWFVVQVTAQSEAKAEEALGKAKVDVWVPRFTAVTVRRGRKVEGQHEFFPGYLFAGLAHANDLGLLFRCEHVLAVLGHDKPLPIYHAVLQVIADRVTGNARSERLAAAAAFRICEMRTVTQGPFQGFMAEITELLLNGRIKAEVHVFGRPTPVEFDPKWLGAA